MKRKLFKILSSVCCVALLLSVFATGAFAHTLSKEGLGEAGAIEPIITDCTWYYLGKVVSTHQQAKYFVIKMDGQKYDEQLYISFPAEGGFRLQSKHEYQTEVEASNVGLFEPSSIKNIDYSTVDGAVVMKGADNTVVRYKADGDGFLLEILNGADRVIYITDEQISFGYNIKGKVVQTMVEMPLRPDKEAIYNGSSRYSASNVVGQHFSLTNKDCFSNEEHSYANVPLFHSNRGYSIWFNMTYPGEANFGCETASSKNKYTITFQGDKLDFYLWTGEPLENLKKYTKITGTSGMTEEWTFGFWTGATSLAWNGENSTQYFSNPYENMKMVLEGFKDNYNFYPEACYGEGVLSNTLSMSYTNARNVKMFGYMRPFELIASIRNTLATYFSETPVKDAQGNFVTTGYPYTYNTLQLQKTGHYTFTPSSWLDMTNPSFKDWVTVKHGAQMGWGGAGAMIDMGENMTYQGTAFIGIDAAEAHNLGAYYYAKYAYEAWHEKRGNDFVLFSRSATAGSQYYTAQFQGDQSCDYKGFYKAVRDMISRGAGGFNLYGSDMGGFSYSPSKDLWNRWVVLSTFSPYMRQHGYYIRVPWDIGYTADSNFGSYYYLRKNIVPSVMDAAMDANLNADPIVTGFMMEYPYDLSLRSIDNQYLFCDDFLVCAVTEEDTHTLEVTLPNGSTWYNLFTNEKVRGDQTLLMEAPSNYMPIFVKGGSVKAINLPDSMTLMDEMHDEGNKIFGDQPETFAHESLLITPPDKERETKIYTKVGKSDDFREFDYTTETYKNTPADKGAFKLTNAAGSRRQIVLALGVTAADVTCDGKKLTRLDHKPDYLNEEFGYYVDLTGMTTIYVPAGWKELSIVKGDVTYKPYAMQKEDGAVNQMYDGDISTAYQLSLSKPSYFTLDTADTEKVGRIAVKWSVGFAQSYDIEYSADGENWDKILPDAEAEFTVTEGGGGVDILNFEPVDAAFFRINVEKRGDTQPLPTIYEIEFFAPDDYVMEIQPDEEEEEEYVEEYEEIIWDEDPNDDDIGEDEENEGKDADEGKDANEGGKKVIKRKLLTTTNHTWLIILIAGIVVVIATALTLLFILLNRKKKKAALAAVAAADEAVEETPTDFPEAEV